MPLVIQDSNRGYEGIEPQYVKRLASILFEPQRTQRTLVLLLMHGTHLHHDKKSEQQQYIAST